MITGAATVEDDGADSLGDRGLCRPLAGDNRVRGIRTTGFLGSNFVAGPNCRDGDAGLVVDELDVDVFAGELDAHARPGLGAHDGLPHPPTAEPGQTEFVIGSHSGET